jgi:acetyl-CoA carboxylase carboxyl transferase subunit beta
MGIFERPRLRNNKRKDMPNDLWTKCPECDAMIHTLDLKQNDQVCTSCDHHFLLGSAERIASIADAGTFEETNAELYSKNPLGFHKYEEKIDMLRKKTGMNDAVVTGRLNIAGNPAMIAVMDFKFFAGSMGSVVGEKITRAIETAVKEKRGMVIVSSSSGARMQEGMLSLMQMAKTCAALARLSEHGLPYISLLTHPTTGGVTASFATIGDINLAEPKCMIGFAGPRVVKETTHQDLPPGFQTAEFMLQHGLVDSIVRRHDVKKKLGQLLSYMMPL